MVSSHKFHEDVCWRNGDDVMLLHTHRWLYSNTPLPKIFPADSYHSQFEHNLHSS